ncbi:MAG: hypothetical protein WBZ29_17810 [Methanocella sp.]
MYIPIAIYKNNVVLIDNMDTFALYFCSSVKQRMRPTVPDVQVDYDADGMPIVTEGEEEFSSSSSSTEEIFTESGADDDDDL